MPKSRYLDENIAKLFPMEMLKKIKGFNLLIIKGFRKLRKYKHETLMIDDYERIMSAKENEILELKNVRIIFFLKIRNLSVLNTGCT
jgi:hypothetical protein